MVNKKQTVLIVEDEFVNRKILNKILSENYNVIEAENGQKAWEILNKSNTEIDAVITDIIMPVMDGYTLLEKMRKHSMNELPIIVTTAYSDIQSEQKALDAGAWDYVPKPYNVKILLSRLRNAIARRQYEVYKRMQKIASHDSLTGLYNRQTMFELTRKMINSNPNEKFAFIRLDIDHFSLYNTSFGEEEGNELLKFFAKCIEQFAENMELCKYCRMSGDIFCVCVAYDGENINISKEIDKIQNKLSKFKKDYLILISVGICLISDIKLSIDEFYFRATIAAQKCKNQYNTHYAFYDDNYRKELSKEIEITNEMGQALEDEQFVLYLQPKFDVRTETSCGAEVLVRWIHPEKGMISPGDFIPVFEKNGFIAKLDYYVWEHTCILLRKWLDEGKTVNPISVNISRISLYNPQLTNEIEKLVKKYNINKSLFQLEITESAYMTNQNLMQDTIKTLRQAGFTILMDDFGSGYSSLNTLKDIEVDILKIDMKFLPVENKVGKGEIILSSIIKMANWIGMSVIVEGVETRRQKDFIEGSGCNFIQGYYYSKPIPASKYEDKYLSGKEIAKSVVKKIIPDEEATILVVDDSEIDQEIIKGFFKDKYSIHICDNAETALAYLKNNAESIKVVLLDNIMPRMSGIEFLDFCNHDTYLKSIPKIMITASSNIEDQVEAFKHGAYDFISKPLKREIVIARVNHVMKISQGNSMYDTFGSFNNDYLEYDSATGILNKKSFSDLSADIIKRYPNDDAALMVIDVDNFKSINDSMGHLAGDKVLKELADNLAASMRKTDLVGRFGGDEFVVFMARISSRKHAKQKATELVKSIMLNCKRNLNINVGVSVGISFFESDDSAETMFARADQALYEAKSTGKNKVVIFGEKVLPIMDDEKPVILVCGEDPQLYPAIALAYGNTAAFANITSYEELVDNFEKYSDRISVICLDVQKKIMADADKFYQYILDKRVNRKIPIMAVCQEGNLDHVRQALTLDIYDILFMPPQIDMIQRRVYSAILYHDANK